MQLIFSDDFRHEFKMIKDQTTRQRIIKHLKKPQQLPKSGKPLQYDLRGHRTVRIPPFRIVYRIDQDSIIINCFDHRKDIYE